MWPVSNTHRLICIQQALFVLSLQTRDSTCSFRPGKALHPYAKDARVKGIVLIQIALEDGDAFQFFSQDEVHIIDWTALASLEFWSHLLAQPGLLHIWLHWFLILHSNYPRYLTLKVQVPCTIRHIPNYHLPKLLTWYVVSSFPFLPWLWNKDASHWTFENYNLDILFNQLAPAEMTMEHAGIIHPEEIALNSLYLEVWLLYLSFLSVRDLRTKWLSDREKL